MPPIDGGDDYLGVEPGMRHDTCLCPEGSDTSCIDPDSYPPDCINNEGTLGNPDFTIPPVSRRGGITPDAAMTFLPADISDGRMEDRRPTALSEKQRHAATVEKAVRAGRLGARAYAAILRCRDIEKPVDADGGDRHDSGVPYTLGYN